MTPEEFRAWRKAEGLPLKRAGQVLGVSYLAALSYDRGYRHDDRRPVTIPEKIALACEAISARLERERRAAEAAEQARSSEPLAPLWGDVSKPIYAALLRALGPHSRPDAPSVFMTHLSRFTPLAGQIMEWLAEGASNQHWISCEKSSAQHEPVVIVQIADPNAAFHFKMRWHNDDAQEKQS